LNFCKKNKTTLAAIDSSRQIKAHKRPPRNFIVESHLRVSRRTICATRVGGADVRLPDLSRWHVLIVQA